MANLPVPSPRTFTVSEVETGAFLNSQRDGLNFLLNKPIALFTQTAAQSIPTGALTAIAFDTTTVDSYGGHSNTTNNTRYTAQVPGWYVPVITGSIVANATGVRYSTLAKNGSQLNFLSGPQVANASFVAATTAVGLVFLNAGDYLEGWTFQNSGGALNTSPTFCQFMVFWLHA